MTHSTVSIVDLPDEVLLHVLKKLDSFDVLHSLVGVHDKLDRLACDPSFTRFVDLLPIEAMSLADSTAETMLDRFCLQILPRIHQQVESLTFSGCFLRRVLRACNYPVLHKLAIVDLEFHEACQLFNGLQDSPLIHAFKQQISHLKIQIKSDIPNRSHIPTLTFVYNEVFRLFTNLTCLDLDSDESYVLHGALVTRASPTAYFSSSIVRLRIMMRNINDCLYLLDGRLNQLQSLTIHLDYIHDPVIMRRDPAKLRRRSWNIMNNLSNPLRLKCFSLSVYMMTSELDDMVLPLVRRMAYLERLHLSLRVDTRNSFVDGVYLNDNILGQMPHLQTFQFDIVTERVTYGHQQLIPTADDIRRRSLESGCHLDCYIDYNKYGYGRCHVYSLPSTLDRLFPITSGFSGGAFINVRTLRMKDDDRPFEHEFFAQISCSFPSLAHLSVTASQKQQEKDVAKSSIIQFPHLVDLSLHSVHDDYVEQFLSDAKALLPCLKKLRVPYKQLMSVTKNLTRTTTRNNCARVQRLVNYERSIPTVRSKDFYLYFPSLL